uniref:NADH-ubiquinone oxidoreductase chain 4 n=1 Tax=Fopius arisanus TaxID=64838 RepID=A0A8F0F6N7_9HYME|nr:NADH dehydrogenase subunit 4 [Fopius arisanus]
MYLKKYFWNLFIINYMMFFTMMFMTKNLFMNYYWSNINYIYGIDFISFILILLTLWIACLSIYAFNSINTFNKNFLIIMIFLTMNLTLSFCCMNFMMFYIFFETSLIPIMIIIMGWGYQIDRIQASMYMLLYTLFGSLPLLLMILFLYKIYNTLMFNILWMINLNNINNFFFFMIMNSAFFIKMPMYMLHLWLPKAHVEAPISGSMILAGIMLKLGSYGLYRSMMILPNLMMKFNKMMILISIFGSLITSLICMNQSDMKIIIAYSSVVHMSMLLTSMFTLFKTSFKGSLMMMIAHGLCSSGMFFLVNLNYERLKSRNFFINKNLLNMMPSLTLWWFLMFSSNFSAPPSLNLLSEILMFNSILQWNKILFILIIFISFFSTCYSIMMYAYSQYGNLNYSNFKLKIIKCKDFLIIMMHWLPLNLLFLNLNLIIYLNLNIDMNQ